MLLNNYVLFSYCHTQPYSTDFLMASGNYFYYFIMSLVQDEPGDGLCQAETSHLKICSVRLCMTVSLLNNINESSRNFKSGTNTEGHQRFPMTV